MGGAAGAESAAVAAGAEVEADGSFASAEGSVTLTSCRWFHVVSIGGERERVRECRGKRKTKSARKESKSSPLSQPREKNELTLTKHPRSISALLSLILSFNACFASFSVSSTQLRRRNDVNVSRTEGFLFETVRSFSVRYLPSQRTVEKKNSHWLVRRRQQREAAAAAAAALS